MISCMQSTDPRFTRLCGEQPRPVKYVYERATKNAAAAIGVNARNCKIPQVYSYSDDTCWHRLRSILLDAEL